jgi:hypothetical protein
MGLFGSFSFAKKSGDSSGKLTRLIFSGFSWEEIVH